MLSAACRSTSPGRWRRIQILATNRLLSTAPRTPPTGSGGPYSPSNGDKWKNDNFVPSNVPQTVILAFGSAILGLLNPERADLIAILGETTGGPALRKIRGKMEETLEGRLILQEKPRINSKTMAPEMLLQLNKDSFGYAYGSFMAGHGYSADDRPVVRHIEDDELAYVMQRYREVHDFLHVLTGAPTTVEGEIGQKAFEFLQTGLPMAALSTAVGPLRLSHEERMRVLTQYLPWAYACNQSCTFLMGIRYENYLEEDLTEFRKQLGVIPVHDYVSNA